MLQKFLRFFSNPTTGIMFDNHSKHSLSKTSVSAPQNRYNEATVVDASKKGGKKGKKGSKGGASSSSSASDKKGSKGKGSKGSKGKGSKGRGASSSSEKSSDAGAAKKGKKAPLNKYPSSIGSDGFETDYEARDPFEPLPRFVASDYYESSDPESSDDHVSADHASAARVVHRPRILFYPQEPSSSEQEQQVESPVPTTVPPVLIHSIPTHGDLYEAVGVRRNDEVDPAYDHAYPHSPSSRVRQHSEDKDKDSPIEDSSSPLVPVVSEEVSFQRPQHPSPPSPSSNPFLFAPSSSSESSEKEERQQKLFLFAPSSSSENSEKEERQQKLLHRKLRLQRRLDTYDQLNTVQSASHKSRTPWYLRTNFLDMKVNRTIDLGVYVRQRLEAQQFLEKLAACLQRARKIEKEKLELERTAMREEDRMSGKVYRKVWEWREHQFYKINVENMMDEDRAHQMYRWYLWIWFEREFLEYRE